MAVSKFSVISLLLVCFLLADVNAGRRSKPKPPPQTPAPPPTPTCFDKKKNGDETGVDCGGKCLSCNACDHCVNGKCNHQTQGKCQCSTGWKGTKCNEYKTVWGPTTVFTKGAPCGATAKADCAPEGAFPCCSSHTRGTCGASSNGHCAGLDFSVYKAGVDECKLGKNKCGAGTTCSLARDQYGISTSYKCACNDKTKVITFDEKTDKYVCGIKVRESCLHGRFEDGEGMGDMGGFKKSLGQVDNPDICLKMCFKRRDEYSETSINGASYGPNRECFCDSNMNKRHALQGVTSSYFYCTKTCESEDLNYEGETLVVLPGVDTWQSCSMQCQAAPTCQFWSFGENWSANKNKCYLRSTKTATREGVKGMISGSRQCFPTHGGWGEWYDATDCTKACGWPWGWIVKKRECNNPPPTGGLTCDGFSTQRLHCNKKYCPIHGGWSAWKAYSTCTKKCGGGKKTRTRTCDNPRPWHGGNTCKAPAEETVACNEHPCPIDGKWAAWTEFSECTEKCGTGKMTRTRTCTNPAAQHKGKDCAGDKSETRECNTHHCPINGNWAQWTKHGNCDAECGGGQKFRTRTCTNPAPKYNGKQCHGDGKQEESCNTHHCPINGNWGKFTEFGKCSVECGGGTQTRTRQCNNPAPKHGGAPCKESATNSRKCNEHPCPINGNWADWSAFDKCSVVCGGGTYTRRRTCTNPAPLHGGKACPGDAENTQKCNEQFCPIHGNWGDWNEGKCSKKCGTGSKILTRVCDDPAPKYKGDACKGDATKTLDCNTDPCPIDGGWDKWSEYSKCTEECGGGLHTRKRTCTKPKPQHGGKECKGNPSETTECNEHPCPIDGGWGKWEEYGKCTKTCGGGTKTRTRKCDNPPAQHGGEKCKDSNTMTVNCNTHNCPINGNWAQWSKHGSCDATCGGGEMMRTRICNNPAPAYGGKQCEGEGEQRDDCNKHECPIHGKWGKFTEWGKCSQDCGGGYQVATRKCDSPKPQFGGDQCDGDDSKIQACNDHPCPIHGGWGSWKQYTKCSKKCGGGTKKRTRTCTNPKPEHGGEDCDGVDNESAKCNEQPCPINGGWGSWSVSGKCSKLCGGGKIEHARECNNPEPKYKGDPCKGDATKLVSCNSHPCPIDGNWGKWTEYSKCTEVCGGGKMTRTRTCNNPAEQFGGAACPGLPSQTTECNTQECPINGGWGEWTSFAACTLTCGGGSKTQTRKCDNPPPQYGGDKCKGKNTNVEDCNTHHCPIDGNWSQWSKHGSCDATCGGGEMMRTRVCNNPAPAYDGAQCKGEGVQRDDCNKHECPIHGKWGKFSEWGKCTKSCGGGTQTQTRKCDSPKPQFDGNACEGSGINTQKCNEHPCPINGNWGEWKQYSKCTKTCGGGTKTRTRECNNPAPKHKGEPCKGLEEETPKCNTHKCPIDGGWGGWTEGSCTVTCGGGSKIATRLCNNPVAKYKGNECPGNAKKTLPCNDNPCPINGGWTHWTKYTKCSKKCGGGTQSHSRTCTNPEPQYDGDSCKGLSTEKRDCNTHHCPIDGKWGEYSEFGACTKVCGGGTKTQTRKCDSPAPQYEGKACEGSATNTEKCNILPCPIDGNWGAWKEYGSCNAECGGGLKKRTRACDNPAPEHGGKECKGSAEESDDCNSHNCPIDGKWGKYTEWSKCSEDCGGGEQIATRECDSPAPKYDGLACSGEPSKSRKCNTHECPIDGQWGSFTKYDECTEKCGGGSKTRTRLCDNPEPQFGGKKCKGKDFETADCNMHKCPIDGGWGEYKVSGKCSVECGGGKIEYTRKCNNPAPMYKGAQCSGSPTKFESCNPHPCPVNGNWGEWAAYDDCTKDCGGGTKTRKRVCDSPAPKHGGEKCPGLDYMTTECHMQPCPIDGKWGPYSKFGKCSVACGGGTQTQTRECNNPAPKHGGEDCKGEADNTQKCNEHPCPIDGDWSQWTTYGKCNQACGTGSKMRTRECNTPEPQHGGKECEGDAKESDKCNTHNCPIDGKWGKWTQFGKCSKECGGGTQVQTRKCNNPAPKYKGAACEGSATNSQPCNDHECPIDGNWGKWTEYSTCTVKCGFGMHTKTRKCDNPRPQHKGKECEGFPRHTEFCNTHPCPIDGGYGEWQIGECDKKCGGGTKTLTRLCNNPVPQHNGKECSGPATASFPCNTHPCPVAGGWSRWTDYSKCNEDCGGGTKTRTRTCSNPAPLYSGTYCQGPSEETVKCNEQHCPIHGNWGAFGGFGACSKACGGGIRSRSRECNNPAPKYGGKTCQGLFRQDESCNEQSCPINGNWGQWSSHGDCSAACGGGRMVRTRKCNNPAPAHGGETCEGSGTQSDMCNDKKCPIDGGWGQFSKFTKCTKSCGKGTRTQTRKCDNPKAAHGGKPCSGSATNTQECNPQPCPINGGWGSYTKFGECSVKCGGGTRTQTRLCNKPEPKHGGADCVGPDSNSEECNEQECPINGGWSEWATNGECSKACGGGETTHTRVCNNITPQFGGAQCPGPAVKKEPCNSKPCPIDGNWSNWGTFSSCTAKCGGGYRSRLRVCNNPAPQYGGKTCDGTFREDSTCNEHHCAIDGQWGAWSGYGDCSAQCGGGKKTKTRGCTFPPPQHGGKPCSGIATIQQDCNTQPCPVDGGWGEWSEHGSCNAKCGGGIMMRTRKCDTPAQAHGGKQCVGAPKEEAKCNTHTCPIDGGWGKYTTFGACSKKCGGGTQTQTRVCNNPAPNHGGKACVGSSINQQECNKQPCPVDGGFGQWSIYSACNKDCGGGFQSRVRECNKPKPQHGGKQCAGKSQQTKNCNEHSCPIDGGWGEFKPEGKCTASCGGGTQIMRRVCDSPLPQHNGKHCEGTDEKTEVCGTDDCPVDGGWGPWTEFGQCTLTCGGGSQKRTRVCNRKIARNGGKKCEGPTFEKRDCNKNPCPIDGLWGEWKPYSECINHLQNRTRDCDNPAPQHNGASCVGDSFEVVNCPRPKKTEPPDVVPVPGGSTKSPYIDECEKEEFLKCWDLNTRVYKMGCYNQTELKHFFAQDMVLLHDDVATGNNGYGTKRIWKCYGNYLHNLVCDCWKRSKESGFKLFSIAQYGKCYGSNDVSALFRAQHTHRKTGYQCMQTNAEYKKCYINKNGDRDGCGSSFKKCGGDVMTKTDMYGECEGTAGFEYVYALI